MPVNLVEHFLNYIPMPDSLQKQFTNHGYNSKDGTITCPKCDGEGKHYYIEDLDCQEGYKLADKKTCKKCGGERRIRSHWLIDRRSVEIKKYKEHVDSFNKTAIILSTIRNKLTAKEREMLGLVKPIPRLKRLKHEV